MNCSIRLCGERHVGLAVELFEQYRQFYGMPPNKDGAHAFLTRRLKQKDSIFLMAESERGVPLGFVQLYPMFSSTRMVRLWVLNDLFVVPDARRKGVGMRLMEAARSHAERHGVRAIALATQKHNAAARKLYEGLGYRLDTEFDHFELTL